MSMKSLKIPYMPVLDSLDLPSAGNTLNSYAGKETIGVINWDKYPYKPEVTVSIARSDDSLYLHFSVKDNSLKAIYSEDNSPVHKDSCVEFFVKTVENSCYMNFEFNCIGACDASRRKSRAEKTALTKEEYSTIRRHSSLKKETFNEKSGIFSWELTVAIPLRLISLDPKALPEKILANFYKCADETSFPHFVSWSPISLPEPDFHCPQFFGELYL